MNKLCFFLVSLVGIAMANYCALPTEWCTLTGLTCPTYPVCLVNGTDLNGLGFNALSFGDLTITSGDVQGAAGVRSNFYGTGGVSVGDQLKNNYPFSLVVGGDIKITAEARIYPSNNRTYVGGSVTGPAELVSAAQTCPTSGCLDSCFNNFQSYWQDFSALLANQADNAVATWDAQNRMVIKCTAQADAVYLTMDAVQFSQTVGYIIQNCKANANYVLNIRGTSQVTFDGRWIYSTGAIHGRVTYNIVEAAPVRAVSQIFGNIIAVLSQFNQPTGVIFGQVVAMNIVNIKQVNYVCFLEFPGTTTTTTTTTGMPATTGTSTTLMPPVTSTTTGVTGPSSTTGHNNHYCPFLEFGYNCNGFSFTLNGKALSFSDFHAISFGGFVAGTGDVEGRLAVRGAVTLGGGYSIGDKVRAVGASATERYSYYSLIAGSVSWISGALYPDGSASTVERAFIAGSVSNDTAFYLKPSFDGPCATAGCLDSIFDAAQSCYTDVQNVFANATPSAHAALQWDGIFITCDNATSQSYIINIDSSLFDSATYYNLDQQSCNDNAVWVINVIGSGDMWFHGGEFPTTTPDNILYNIIGSGRTVKVVGTSVNGNILAPHNTLYQPDGVVRGKVVAGDITMSLQINKPTCVYYGLGDIRDGSSSMMVPSIIMVTLAAFFAFF